MLLRIQGEEFTKHVFEEILLLTGSSHFLVDSLSIDEKEQYVRFAIERRRLKNPRRRILGLVSWPQYDDSALTRTLVEIRGVENAAVENKFDDGRKDFSILIGITVEKTQVFLCSAEEITHGKPSYILKIALREIDITLRDIP